MEEELTDSEKAQMRQIVTLQKVSMGIIAKWRVPLTILFSILVVIFSGWLVRKAAYSVHRFTAQTRLLYNPKNVANIGTMSDKQLMSILERNSLKRRIGDRVDMPLIERECLTTDVELKQAKHPSNLFNITAASKSWVGAVKKANVYAEILIKEYADYRTKDLKNWSESLSARHSTLMDQLSEIETEEAALKAQTGVMSPQEALLSLNALISDQRRNSSALSVEAANEELKKRKLEETVGGEGEKVMANAQAIRRRSEAIAAIDAEIASLRERYTDINPKVSGKLHERELLVADLQAFLVSKGVQSVDLENLDQVEHAATELSSCVTKLDVINEKRRAIDQEIKDNEKRASELAAMLPDYERLVARRLDIQTSARALDEQMNDISYLEGSLHNDLRQIERASGATDENPLGIKQFLLAAIGAAICCFVAAMWIVVIEMAFGKVRGGREVAAHYGVNFIGSLPEKGVLKEDEDREVVGVMSLKVFLACAQRRAILICRLPGANVRHDFAEAIDFTASMSGVSVFLLDIVSGAAFEPPEGVEQMIGVVRKDNHGWFPAANRFAMAPTELQMLQADIAELRNSFDNVFIRMEGGIRVGGTFFDQLLGLCDSVVLEVGTETTSRAIFGYARRHITASGKPLMALVTGAKAKTIRSEMEAKI